MLKRPVAVTAILLAFVAASIFSLQKIPISLLPDIDIPKITVFVENPGISTREFQNSVVQPLINQLSQTGRLDKIDAEAGISHSRIQLNFSYGTDTDLAYIETNEKIDAIMPSLPEGSTRPQAVKASASDIPVFNLNVSTKQKDVSAEQFINLSRFAESVLKKRAEQLEGIAFTDITGLSKTEIRIIPDYALMKSLGINSSDIKNAIISNNTNYGTVTVKDGNYQYELRISETLYSSKQIENIYLKVNERLLQLKDIAKIAEVPEKEKGEFYFNGNKAVQIQIIKQADARMATVQEELGTLLAQITEEYPELEFTISQDQTKLLEYSISNLQQSLLIGIILAALVMFFFQRQVGPPLLTALTVPVSVLISMLFFFFFGVSVNIISLAGLILGAGLMIDNSIIVIDNITQYREQGYSSFEACMLGTKEVLRPLLSSALTTSFIFLPLIFISGIAGALFYDMAVAVSVGLGVSFFVSITLLPVYYNLLFKNKQVKKLNQEKYVYRKVYDKISALVLSYRKTSLLIFVSLCLASYFLFTIIKKEKLPHISENDFVVKLEWLASTPLEENKGNVMEIIASTAGKTSQTATLIGKQQFLYNTDKSFSDATAQIYFKGNSNNIDALKNQVTNYIKQNFPDAHFDILKSKNIFSVLFPSEKTSDTRVVIRPYNAKFNNQPIDDIFQSLADDITDNKAQFLKRHLSYVLKIDRRKLLLFDIEINALSLVLQEALGKSNVTTFTGNNISVPVNIQGNESGIKQIIKTGTVKGNNGINYPISNFITLKTEKRFGTILTDQNSEYYYADFSDDKLKLINEHLPKYEQLYPNLEIALPSKEENAFNGLFGVLAVSLLMLYFILAAQFESLLLPFIVLLEIPADAAGALFLAYLAGSSLNIMSAAGIILMSGIVINDSILKIETMNRYIRDGMQPLEAVKKAGRNRLKAILTTSITTILAMVPFLFMSGIGAELQYPLALAVIGGIFIGTLISLFFLPLFYLILTKSSPSS